VALRLQITTLSSSSHDAGTPAVAADANGNVKATWAENDGSGPESRRIVGSDSFATQGSWTPDAVVTACIGSTVGEPGARVRRRRRRDVGRRRRSSSRS
jgi:hypothetical protein